LKSRKRKFLARFLTPEVELELYKSVVSKEELRKLGRKKRKTRDSR